MKSKGGILAALFLMLVGCGGAAGDVGSGESDVVGSDARDIGNLKITMYTLAKEGDFPNESEFLCSGRGVAMQGTGIRADGSYVKYASGGGGWCDGYNRLCNCASAKFIGATGVIGASGRELVKGYSIAVDPARIPLGSSVWLAALGRWFRADDTGGAIKGAHIDLYIAGDSPSEYAAPESSKAFISSAPHEADDPGPNGEAGKAAASSKPSKAKVDITPRPAGGEFSALDIRGAIADGGWLTQCNESADGERVWMTTKSGKDASSRWAEAKYPQLALNECGRAASGVYPIVLRSEPADALGGTVITQCLESGQKARVFEIDGELDGHPIATFKKEEDDSSCP